MKNNTAVIIVRSQLDESKMMYDGAKEESMYANMNGAPEELRDRIKAMLQNTSTGDISCWSDFNTSGGRGRPLSTLSGSLTSFQSSTLQVNTLLNWILASGWTLTQTCSTNRWGVITTYVFQK